MKQILLLSEVDFNPIINTSGRANYTQRKAARAVLQNNNGEIALLHSNVRNYYKLPGGGVENEEDMASALKRELLEEVGADADVTAEIGEVEEWCDSVSLHQISHGYLAKTVGDLQEPEFTEEELADGFEVVWATNIQDAIDRVESALDNESIEVKFMALRDARLLRRSSQLNI